MDEDKKKTLKLGIFILIMCLFAVGLFAWGFLGKGKLVFHGDPPFTVMILGEESVECEESPCEIRIHSGIKDIFITKTGYRDVYRSERVRTWRSTKVELEFRMEPMLTQADEMPQPPEKTTYSISTEAETGAQRLVDEEDGETVVYFQRPLEDPRVYGEERFILVVSREIYKVDALNKTREEMEEIDLPEIREVKWSMDGRYMLFTREDSRYLRILDTRNAEIKRLSLFADISLTDWIHDNRIMFLTNQSFGTDGGRDEEGYPYGEPMDEVIEEGYTLGFYYPDSDRYSRVQNFMEITQTPSDFIAMSNGKSAYFRMEDQNFRIILEKF